MKRLFYVISLVGIMLIFPTLLIGQILDPEVYSYDCIEEENNAFVDTTYRGLYESRNGASHSPHGEIRFLVAFVELLYEGAAVEDPSPDGTEQWRPGELPIWKDDFLSPFTPNGISSHHLTKYYQHASSNNHIVLGDYLVAPTNGGVFQVSTVTDNIGASSIINAINQQLGDTIRTAHGLNSISDFDKWITVESENNFGTEKSNTGNGQWDYVVFVVRNSINPPQACGVTYYSGTEKELLGFPIDAYTIVCTNDEIPTHIIRHEYAHMLLGGNNMHTAGGGYSSSNYNGKGNYWIPQTGGWGLLGLYGCSLWCWNAWDRQRLGWVDSTSTYEISARNQNGIEVNGDLDATDPNDAGIYVLRDFVTTGDAIRIKLPYIDSDKEYQEWLWIENHQGVDNNNNEFDQWQYQDRECVKDLESGLMVYIQINNDTRVSDNYKYIYNDNYNHADYTRVLTANGLWDRDFLLEYVGNECVSYDSIRPFVRLFENPFTGTEDQSQYACDLDNDNKIEWNDFVRTWTELDDSVYYKNLWQLGHSSHSFNLQGNRKIGMGTNPSTATLINMVGENQPYSTAKNLRKTYLNGISVEMLEQLPNGDIMIRVRFDDVDIENNVRWCSDSIVLNPIVTNSGYSLNLKSGRKIRLDQGLTPTRMTNPVMFNNQKIFASPTTFTVMPDAKIHLESLSKIIIENGSKMHLSEGSSCVIESAGYIEVKRGTTLQLDDCSSLIIKGRGKLIVREGAELRISPNAVLACQNGFNNIVVESGVVIPNGFVNPISLINNTIGDVVINTNTNWNNIDYDVYGTIVVENDAVLNVGSSTLRFTENNGIVIKPRGKLVVDSSLLTATYCSNQWQGIEVWGNDSLHQNLSNGQYYQGILELKNGATIENAVCAVELWNPLDNHSEGGIVHATDAIFRNNAKAVHALNYTNYNPANDEIEMSYNSNFENCTFVIDSNYMGEEIFQSHVDLNNVNGLDFYACSFSVDRNVPQVSDTPHGISAYNAGFAVDHKRIITDSPVLFPTPDEYYIKSMFDGFETGIYSVSDGVSARTFAVENSVFTNNDKAIYALNTGYAIIVDNSITVGSDADCSFGLYLDRVSNFKIEENMFSGDNSHSSDNYGVVIKNSESYNDVYLNTFNNLKYGNVALGKNYVTGTNVGLTYTCNVNVGNIHDFCIFKENFGVAGIAPHQGSSTMPAGNTFSGSSTHIYNNGNSPISYYYYTQDNSQRPNTFKLSSVNAIGTSRINRCLSSDNPGIDIMGADDVVTLENAYNTTLAAYNALLQTNSQSMETTEDIEAQLSQLKTEYLNTVGEIVKFYLQQEEKDYEELREWLVKSEDIFADRMVVASFIQEGNYDDAMTYATMLPKIHNLKGEELQDHNDYMKLIDLYIDLHETNRSTNQLTDAELTMVKNIADNGIGVSRSMAEVMVSINDLIMITPRCLTIPSDMTTTQQTRGAEQEIEFAPVGTKWYYDYNEDMTGWDNGYVLIESVIDTLIDDMSCRKLVKTIYEYNQDSNEEQQRVIGYEYVSQIDDSVMIYRDGEFKKLYDFGAEVGDTLIIPGHDYDPALTNGQGVVVDKGTIEFDGQTLRYIDLKHPKDTPWQFPIFVSYGEDYYTVRICEKIGNISGYLLPEPYNTGVEVLWEGGGALRCYSDNVMSVSFQDKVCDYIVSVDGISSQGSINIFPNPANDNITIELTADCHTIEIYDSFGRMMMSQQVTESLSHQVVDIDISKYPSGLYLVVVKDDNNRYYKRIVKN